MFFLDCEVATFCRVPPHLTIAEMQSTLPSTEATFAAPGACAWHTEMLQSSGKETHSVRTITSMLMGGDALAAYKALANTLSIHGLLQALCGKRRLCLIMDACTSPNICVSAAPHHLCKPSKLYAAIHSNPIAKSLDNLEITLGQHNDQFSYAGREHQRNPISEVWNTILLACSGTAGFWQYRP